MTDQKRHEMLKALIMLWLGGFLLGLATAIFGFHGFGLTPALIGGSGSVLSGLALTTMLTQG